MRNLKPLKVITLPNQCAVGVLIGILETRRDFLNDEFHDQIVIDETTNSGTIDEIRPCINAFNELTTITTLLERVFMIAAQINTPNIKLSLFNHTEIEELRTACDCRLDMSSDMAYEAIPTIQPTEEITTINRQDVIDRRTELTRNINDIKYSSLIIGMLN